MMHYFERVEAMREIQSSEPISDRNPAYDSIVKRCTVTKHKPREGR